MNWTQFLSILAIIYGLYYSFFIFLDMLRARSSGRKHAEHEQLLTIPMESATRDDDFLPEQPASAPQKVELPATAALYTSAPIGEQPSESPNTGSEGGLVLPDVVDQALKDSIENMKDIFGENPPAHKTDRRR